MYLLRMASARKNIIPRQNQLMHLLQLILDYMKLSPIDRAFLPRYDIDLSLGQVWDAIESKHIVMGIGITANAP